ncbi:MAG: hypothetical protein ACUVX9_10470 [Anaerolineae bacterium]
MSNDLIVLLWLVVAAVLMWLAQRLLHSRIQGVVLLLTGSEQAAVVALFLLLLPGIAIHELSHWLAARLLRVRTGPISIGLERKRGRQIRFGSVQVGRADPFRESLIGLAPLLAGTGLVLLFARFGLRLQPDATLPVSDWPGRLLGSVNAADAWLWIYLLFAVANAMVPSASDRRAWQLLGVYLLVVLLIVHLLVGLPRIAADGLHQGARVLSYLAFAFSLTALLDVAVLALLLPLEFVIGHLTGRRLTYR